jgi:hypothetical protein
VCAYAKEQELPLSRETIDAKLQLVAEDSDGIVGRIGDTGGGLYVIDYGRAVERACRAEVDSQVREKLGDKVIGKINAKNDRKLNLK